MKVVVIGGSITGLGFALFASRRGMAVTLVDADPMTDTKFVPDEALARQPRRPTPQSAHSHAFLARSHKIFLNEAPEVLDAFAVRGVESVRLADHLPASLADHSKRPGDDELVVLRSRRSTLESALRAVVAAEDGVTCVAGVEVTGLCIDDTTSVPHVTAVKTSAGRIEADVVIDASGRRGRTFAWLGEAGVSFTEDTSECGIAYYTRFYRRYFGERVGGLNRGYTAGSSFDRYSALVFPADNSTFSVTFGILPEDAELRKLRHGAAFDVAAESIPLIADWHRRGEPISEVRSMTGMKNRLRRLVTSDETAQLRPTVTGLIPLGDAAGISNPAHSRGCSLALSHAQQIADLLDQRFGSTTPGDLTLAAEEIVGKVIAPWVEDSRAQDEARLSRWRPDGDHRPPAKRPDSVSNGEAWMAAHHDREVWSQFTRLQQLLANTEEVLADAETVARVKSVQDRGLGLPKAEGPSHDDLVKLLTAATPHRADRQRIPARL